MIGEFLFYRGIEEALFYAFFSYAISSYLENKPFYSESVDLRTA